jgi:hypothetical protein
VRHYTPRLFIRRACDFFDLFVFLHIRPAVFQALDKAVILRACDFFNLFVFSAYPTCCISSLDKAVILSEALRRSISSGGFYGAESKDPGDACWQMLLGAFWPQTTTEDKKVTNSALRSSQAEGSAVPRTSPGNEEYYTQTNLSSRPERSVVESCDSGKTRSMYGPNCLAEKPNLDASEAQPSPFHKLRASSAGLISQWLGSHAA